MKVRDFDCPSCGASLKIKKKDMMLTCPYCESTVIVPSELLPPEHRTMGGISAIPININTSAATKSCSKVIVVSVLMMVLSAGLVFFLVAKAQQGKLDGGALTGLMGGGGPPVLMEFGGEGMGAGYFTDPECIALDSDGNIFVGEFETGRIQVFNSNGDYIRQWEFGKGDDIYLYSMASTRDGTLYLIYDSEIHIHDGMTGEYLGELTHSEGWGFEDIYICDDGSILTSWYCNRDDIIRFSPDGSVDLVITEAITTQSGDSELQTYVAADGRGNIFAFGSFNESVFKFTEGGRYITRFGSEGDRPGQFTSPSCFTIDSHGRLWFSDFGDLIVFDNDGLFLNSFDPDYFLSDIIITGDYRLLGLTNDDTIVELDISEWVEEL